MRKIVIYVICALVFFGIPLAMFVSSIHGMADAVQYPIANQNIEMKGGQLWSWDQD